MNADFPNLCNGNRIVEMVLNEELPYFLSICGYQCRVWYRGQPIQCIVCRDFGHRAQSCPLSGRCRYCHHPGHKARECARAWVQVPPTVPADVDPGDSSDSATVIEDESPADKLLVDKPLDPDESSAELPVSDKDLDKSSAVAEFANNKPPAAATDKDVPMTVAEPDKPSPADKDVPMFVPVKPRVPKSSRSLTCFVLVFLSFSVLSDFQSLMLPVKNGIQDCKSRLRFCQRHCCN